MSDIYAFIRKMTGHELVTQQDAKALTAAVDNLIDEVTDKQKRINAHTTELAALKAENKQLTFANNTITLAAKIAAERAEAAERALAERAGGVRPLWRLDAMTDAREIIALELARISKIDMSEAPPYARASIHTAALHIERALISAGFRIIGPDEVDPVTVDDVAAELWKAEAEDAGAPASIANGRTRDAFDDQSDELKRRWRKFARAAIRAIGRKA